MGEALISCITCCLTPVDISEMCLLIVSLDNDTCRISFALVSPKINFTMFKAQGFISVSPIIWGFLCLAICNATSKEACTLAVLCWQKTSIQSFAYTWLHKGNQNEFLKHPKIKWLDGEL